MIVLDVNVLLAAFRQDHPHHAPVRPWFEQTLARETAVVVPDLVWVGFLRIVTNDHVFAVPSPIGEAIAFLEAVTETASYVPVAGLSRGWSGFAGLAVEARAAGNLVPDAYVAAVADALACPVATMDRDFRRFPGLTVVDPSTV